jgi:hypothetical protein
MERVESGISLPHKGFWISALLEAKYFQQTAHYMTLLPKMDKCD